MAKKNKYEKILARKKVLLADATSPDPKPLSYQHAMELVRSNRRAGNYQLGNYYLEQIAEQVTVAPEPTVYLLHVYLDEVRLDEAQRLANILQDKFPISSSALRARTRFHQLLGELHEAEALMQKAVKIYPNNLDNLDMLAGIYQSIGRGRQALDCYDRALRIKSDDCSALFGKARLLGKNATTDLIAQVKSAIESNKYKGMQLGSLHLALSFIYADTDIDLHFAHLNAGNRVIAARRGFDIAAKKKEAETILERFQRQRVDALQGLIIDDYKPIFIVSMPRSGTTLLEQIIGAHPQCQAIGESNAFPTAIAAADKFGALPPNVSSPQAIEQYRQYFLRVADCFKNNRLVAAATGKSPVAKTIGNHMNIGLILLTFPNARVINLERHPLAVIYSCYQQYFSSGNTFSFDLEWAAEYYKIYKKLMTHWKAVFPDKILTVHYERLVRDKQHEVERILKFCDLEWDPACLEHQKAVGMILTASDMQVRQPVYQSSAERWKKVEPYLEPAKRLLGEWLEYPK